MCVNQSTRSSVDQNIFNYSNWFLGMETTTTTATTEKRTEESTHRPIFRFKAEFSIIASPYTRYMNVVYAYQMRLKFINRFLDLAQFYVEFLALCKVMLSGLSVSLYCA